VDTDAGSSVDMLSCCRQHYRTRKLADLMGDHMTLAAETIWIVLATDGRHSMLGRHTDPTREEIESVEVALKETGLAGWLAVMRGVYYSRKPVELLMVRPLGEPGETWEVAAKAFDTARKLALRSS
jgi:hypothetical protein